jgi:hypothetical protein
MAQGNKSGHEIFSGNRRRSKQDAVGGVLGPAMWLMNGAAVSSSLGVDNIPTD